MRERTEAEMLHRMAAYCSSAERCRQDVEKKLISAAVSPESCERILARLVKEKFLDDARFSKSFVNDKLRFNKWGRTKIVHELRKRNISPAQIDDALSVINENEYKDVLQSLMKTKLKSTKGKNSREINQKLIRFALSRGFTMNETLDVLRTLIKNLQNDFDNYDDL